MIAIRNGLPGWNQIKVPLLGEAFAWWTARMTELAPAWLKPFDGSSASAVIIVAGDTPGAPVTLLRRYKNQETSLGVLPANQINRRALSNGTRRNLNFLLRPPDQALLETHIDLPLAALPEVRNVVGYDISRTTPFEPNQIYWNCTVETRDRARGRIRVRLSLVRKDPLQPLLAELAQAGIHPTALEAVSPDAQRRVIMLNEHRPQPGWQRRACHIMAVTCAACAVIAVLLPFAQQWWALSEVEARIAALQPQATQVQSIRQRIAAVAAGDDVIIQERVKLGNALKVLSAVTNVLPDDTFLEQLSLRQRQLAITGRSGAAAKLIAAMAADPTFQNPGFSAPVRRNDPAKADDFSIRSVVGP